jgi:secreted trypsin-like serine protease
MTQFMKKVLMITTFSSILLQGFSVDNEGRLRGRHPVTSSKKDRISSNSSRYLIYGGTEVREGDYPYLAFIDIIWENTTSTVHQYCGGTLIHPNWVLTSASCALDAVEIAVILGAHDVTDACDQGPPVECSSINIEKDVFTMPEYNYSDYNDDFALLRLSKPSNQDTAFLNVHYFLPGESDKLRIVGRGGTDENEPYSPVPMEKQVDFVSHEECELEYNEILHADLQCARSQGLSDTCYADSGGPIIIRPTDEGLLETTGERDILVGVISWGLVDEGCQTRTRPFFYNRVTSAFTWMITVAPEILESLFTERR